MSHEATSHSRTCCKFHWMEYAIKVASPPAKPTDLEVEDIKMLFTGLYVFFETEKERAIWLKLITVVFRIIDNSAKVLRDSLKMGQVSAQHFHTMTTWSVAYKAKLDHPDTKPLQLLVRMYLDPPSPHIPCFTGEVFLFEKLDGFTSCVSIYLHKKQPALFQEDIITGETTCISDTTPIRFVFNFNQFETFENMTYYLGNRRTCKRSLYLRLW